SPTLTASILATIGFGERLNDNNVAAEQFFRRSIAAFAQAGRGRGPEAVSVRSDWAVVSEESGNPRRALQEYDETLRMAAQSDPVAPPPPYLLANRAFALRSLGRFSDARESYLGCTAQTERIGETTGLAACMLGLAGVEYELGNLNRAEDWINKAAGVVGTSVP